MGKKERIAELEAQVRLYHALVGGLAGRLGMTAIEEDGPLMTAKEYPRVYEAFHRHITDLRDRAQLELPGVSPAPAAPPQLAIVRAEDEAESDGDAVEQVAEIFRAAAALAGELEIKTHDPDTGEPRRIADLLNDVLSAMGELKGGADVSGDAESTALTKGDTLAGAMIHNSRKIDEMAQGVSQARLALRRIGEALGVTQADPDGELTLEKAQQWGVFCYYVKKRYAHWNEMAANLPTSDTSELAQCMRNARAELANILARLVAPAELAKWLKDKAPAVATAGVLGLAEDRTVGSQFERFTAADVERVAHAVTDYVRAFPAEARIEPFFTALRRSPSAVNEFVTLMNLVILPIVTRIVATWPTPTPTPN